MIDLSNYFTLGNKWLYDLLAKEKQKIFPNDYQINFLYTEDQYDSDTSAGEALTKLQEYLASLDIPNFFVIVHTNNPDISQELLKVKNIVAPTESDISIKPVDGTFKKNITNKNSLCVYPWMHLYVNPQGLVGTCCSFNINHPLGDLSDSSLSDISNNNKIKTVRRQMLDNQRPEICSYCWANEDSGLPSMRQSTNEKFSKYLPLVDQTADDGSFEEFKLRHLDFRASNICNLKCRMCGGKFSSRIAEEEANLYQSSAFVELKLTNDEIINTLAYIENNIQNLESIFFCGGEPLMMSEHYQILDLLIKHQRTNIEIMYVTNLTVLKYKSLSVIDYWKKFSNITLQASIDLIGDACNYVRHGSNHDDIEANYHQIKDLVKFKINSTLSLYNVFNLPQLQKRWVSTGLLGEDILLHTLITPDCMSLQVLPAPYKALAKDTIKQHQMWLKENNADANSSFWDSAIDFMEQSDQSHLLSDFFKLNDDKDRYRKEQFEQVFPEYKDLRKYV